MGGRRITMSLDRAIRSCGWRALAAAVALAAAGPVHAAVTYALAASATVISKSSCKINTAAGSVLAFGNINPSSALSATASVALTLTCSGSAPTAVYSLGSNGGLFSTGPNAPRMRHATVATAFLPYTLNLPASGSTPKGTATTFTVIGTITPADFGNAVSGAYSDTVILSLTP
jgi:spore coat protein U-like protein